MFDVLTTSIASPILSPLLATGIDPAQVLAGATLLSVGHNGVAFLDCSATRVVKVSWLVLDAIGYLPNGLLPHAQQYHSLCAVEMWRDAFKRTAAPREQLVAAARAVHGLGVSPPTLEAIGAIVAERQLLGRVVAASGLSRDGLALVRPYVRGTALSEWIVSSDARVAPQSPLWGAVAQVLRAALDMAGEFGLVVDVVNPGNFIVGESGTDIVLIDTELVDIDQQARDYLRTSYSLEIPPPRDGLPFNVSWPWVPEQLLQSKLWSLSLAQGVSLIRHVHGIDEESALRRIAMSPRFEIAINHFMEDGTLIHAARETLDRGTRHG